MSMLIQHWELKLLALGLSLVLWGFVMTSEKAELIMAAPLELDDIPVGLEVQGERPESVDVQLRGLRGALARLGSDRVRARLNLAGARAGEVVIRVMPEQIAVPHGVTVLRVSPSRVRLVLGPVRS